jgi:hypothetical protein
LGHAVIRRIFVSNTLKHRRNAGEIVVLFSDSSKLCIKQLLPDTFRFLANARSFGSVPISSLFTRPHYRCSFFRQEEPLERPVSFKKAVPFYRSDFALIAGGPRGVFGELRSDTSSGTVKAVFCSDFGCLGFLASLLDRFWPFD